MALTPEDVVNQKFTITKFRDGYDLDQVDDFLDTIVEELRQHEQVKADLEAQIADLTSQLEAARQQGASGEAPEAVKSDSEEPDSVSNEEVEQLRKELEQAREEAAQARQEAESLREGAEQAAQEEGDPADQTIVVDAPTAAGVAASPEAPKFGATEADAVKSSAMLQLALELHDKHVHEGETTRERLINEGQKKHDELVTEAQKLRADELAQLASERTEVEDRIKELRTYESEYRTTLRSYIQGQLRSLDGSPEPAGGPDLP